VIIETESNGHIGTYNEIAEQRTTKYFRLVLSWLKLADGHIEYVIHIVINKTQGFYVQPSLFLAEIGVQRFQGCPIAQNDDCFYAVYAKAHLLLANPKWFVQGQNMLDRFLAFAEQIDKLFELRQEEERILQTIGVKSSGKFVIGPPTELKEGITDIPSWVNEVKYARLRQLEAQRTDMQKEIDHLSQILPLIYATDTPLEEAVVYVLRFLGLHAELTEPGFTTDVRAWTQDGTRKFGIEVTGINGMIKKNSRKLTQVMEFEQIKEDDEKTVLLANTHNTTPISHRKDLEDFTQPVLDFLGRHPILLMTGWDLYRIVGDVINGTRTREEIVDILYTTNGRWEYKPIGDFGSY
jgi:hypothetical protein